MCAVDTSRGGASLTHQGLLYGCEEEFLAGVVPVIREGLECGDLVQIATTNRNAGWLRAALDTDAGRVMVLESSQCYRHPVRALATVHHTVQAASRGGQRLRLIGEPVWTAPTALESKEWARYESLVNAALAWAHAVLVCTYDVRVVDSAVVAEVARTHPELVVNGAARPSPSYLDPAVFTDECDKRPLPELPRSALNQRFDGAGQVATVRDVVRFYATQAGAVAQKAERFVQAVEEVMRNAIEYGGGSGVVRVWSDQRRMLCEVSDTGAGLRNPLDGHLPCGRSTPRGRRLWLARQLCDLVEVRTDLAGTTVRLHLTLS